MKLLRYILFEKYYIYISALEVASPGNRHCANCIGTLSFAMCREQCEGSMGGRFRYWSHDGRSGGRLTRPMSIRPTDVSVLASIHRQWRSRDLEVRGAGRLRNGSHPALSGGRAKPSENSQHIREGYLAAKPCAILCI